MSVIVGVSLVVGGQDGDWRSVGLDLAGEESGSAAEREGIVEKAFVDTDTGGTVKGESGKAVELE